MQLTQDGPVFHEQGKYVLPDIDEPRSLFQQRGGAPLQGRVRIDRCTGLARCAVIPRLPEPLAQHPQLALEISSTERRVALTTGTARRPSTCPWRSRSR